MSVESNNKTFGLVGCMSLFFKFILLHFTKVPFHDGMKIKKEKGCYG